jgi:soluble P-type ATPase
MLCISIPGRRELRLSHLILDYNGTIALDGQLIPGVASRLEALARELSILVITADTHGTAARACADLPVQVLTFPTDRVGEIKAREAMKLQGGTLCIGNGFNDVAMAEACDLSVCVIGKEGCCGALLAKSDVVVTSVTDGLDLLLKPDRLRATLRT